MERRSEQSNGGEHQQSSHDVLVSRSKRHGGDFVEIAFTPAGIRLGADSNCADSFQGPLGAQVLGPDKKDNASYEAERVSQHEPFHLAVVATAPMRPPQEGPADFN